MSGNEEKIKEFLNDANKMKALKNDEEFMNTISGGKATPETYANELKKFGIELSDDEARDVQKCVNRFLCEPIDELDDKILEDVSGGSEKAADIVLGTLGATSLGLAVASFGCSVAYMVYKSKEPAAGQITAVLYGSPGMFKRPNARAKNYAKKAEKLKKISMALVGGATATAAAFGTGCLVEDLMKDND